MMPNILKFKSVRSRLTFWFLVVAVVPLLLFFGVIYEMRVNSIKEKEINKLSAIRDLKAEQINGWLDGNAAGLQNIAGTHQFRILMEAFYGHKDYEADPATQEAFRGGKERGADPATLEAARRRLEQYSKGFLAFTELSILHNETGVVIISSNKARQGENSSQEAYYQEPSRTGQTYIHDVTWSNAEHRPVMIISTPIRCLKHNSEHIIGFLTARINLKDSLYKLLQNRTGLGITGETFLVNHDGLALSELKWHDDAILKLKMRTRSVLLAIGGGTGTGETEDYRGMPVLAAYTHIPRLGWGFVTKQDVGEVSSEILQMTLHMLFLLGISTASVFVIGFFIAKTIAQPVIDMARVSKAIESGDLSARNTVQAPNELGYLAQTFNGMAESVQKQLVMLQGISELNQVMMSTRELSEFYPKLLEKLMDLTSSDVGVCFKYSHDCNRFDPAAFVGVNLQLLEPFSAEYLEGQFGKPLSTGKICHTTAVPEDTRFTFKTIVGTAVPREIITMPISVRDRAQIVLSFASLAGYSDYHIKITEHVSTNITTALSNLMASEETERLAAELQAKNTELKAQADEMLTQARELEQQSAELQQQNIELGMQRKQVEEASRLKSTFLSNMSHELRTPLNSVMALSKVLMMDAEGKFSEEELSYLEIIERNGKKLLSLINDILDLSKIEAGKVDLNVSMFSVTAAIQDVVERLQPIAEAKGLELTRDLPDDLPRIESDAARLDQVLQNIIGNAVKFTDEGGVSVSAYRDGDRIHIRAADTGIGIPRSEMPHIFEEFRQVDGSPSRRHEGTGLGLAIANKTTKLLRGELSCESTYGEGSTFTLSLPIEWSGEIASSVPFMLKESARIAPFEQTILVVDDDPVTVDLVAGYLAEEGYDTIKAFSGEEALRLARTHHPFAITLDIIMPGMDGWEVLQALKANPETADIPVFVVTVANDRATGIALGAVGFVSKPVIKELLVRAIRKLGKPATGLIMVVDDDEMDRREIASMLEQEGMSTICAEDGRCCLAMLKEALPDVLVLDLIMPDMDGFEVLDSIRKDPRTLDLNVIIVTAKDLTSEDKAALSGQVGAVLAKSEMMPIALLDEIKKSLARLRTPLPRIEEPRKAKRILMVEDNETAVIQVKSVLEHEGYIVDIATGGKEAIEYVQHTIPDGIILDLMMPEIDGFEVLEQIRGSRATATIPVLVLTAKDLTSEDLGKLSANHIQQLVQKGDVDAEHLLFKIGLMLSSEPKSGREALYKPKLAPPVQPKKKPAPTKRPDEPAAGQPTVLVVEDNPDNMTTVRAILKNRYRIIEATDGEEGLERAISELPDLILLDMALPKMDGLTVLGRLNSHERARSIPVIAMTAKAMKGDREQIIEAGSNDYISKPIEPVELLDKLERYLAGNWAGGKRNG